MDLLILLGIALILIAIAEFFNHKLNYKEIVKKRPCNENSEPHKWLRKEDGSLYCGICLAKPGIETDDYASNDNY